MSLRSVQDWEAGVTLPSAERLLALLRALLEAGGLTLGREMSGVALSQDGRLVASAGDDGTVRLWDTGTGQPLASLQAHAEAIRGVALSADGRRMAGGGADGVVRVWDTANGELRASLPGHAGAVRGVALSADGQLLASGDTDGTVRLWEPESGQLRAALRGHTAEALGVALSGDARLVASGSGDGTIRIWDASSGACLNTLQKDRPFQRADITGLRGVTEAQRSALLALGAFERPPTAAVSALR